MTYAFASNQFKPYVKELFSTRGENILRDAPADHLHHHGLMYAIRVNGVNFWEERDQPGHQRHVEWIQRSTDAEGQAVRAQITELIHWVKESDAGLVDTAPAALLIERRTLTVSVNDQRQEVGLGWRSEFEVGPAAPVVKLHGSAYNGLGFRLPASWDHVALHRNSETRPYTLEQKWDVTPARWASVEKKQEGGGVTTVVLFGQPQNRGETRFFSMLNPFTYLSVTQNLENAPLEYRAGDKFAAEYLVLVYPEHKAAGFLEGRYQAWVKGATP